MLRYSVKQSVEKKTSYLKDEEIVSLLLERNQKGIDFLYKQYGKYIYGFIFEIVKYEDISEIVLQDTFLKVWTKIDSFNKNKGIFLTWVISIARNTAIDMIRSKNYKQMLRLVSLENLSQNKQYIDEGLVVDNMDVRANIKKIDPKCVEILELVYFKGYSGSEVAKKLGIPHGTVKSRIRKAFKDLRKIMDR